MFSSTIAGAGAKVCQALDRFGDLLGFGYQVQNDLASLAEDPEYKETRIDCTSTPPRRMVGE